MLVIVVAISSCYPKSTERPLEHTTPYCRNDQSLLSFHARNNDQWTTLWIGVDLPS